MFNSRKLRANALIGFFKVSNLVKSPVDFYFSRVRVSTKSMIFPFFFIKFSWTWEWFTTKMVIVFTHAIFYLTLYHYKILEHTILGRV